MAPSIQFHYQTYGEKNNPPLLFLHGFMGNIADWRDIALFFSDRNYCLAVDFPGHGQTKVAAEADYRMENCAADLMVLLDRLNIKKCRVVSYSMGGRLAFYAGVTWPARFDKMVIESASPGLKTQPERSARVRHDAQVAQALEELPISQFLQRWYDQPLFGSLDKRSEPYRRLFERRLNNDINGLILSLKHMGAGAQPPVWDKLDRICADTLLIVGSKDEKYKRIALGVQQRCRRASVRIIEDAGHNVHFENRDEYVRQVDLFINKRG
jgi:2-succinyl-6-hydroxy-2,4-cyclohexadiene-1-carboxylate synthase